MRTGPDDTENTRLTNWIISLLLSGSMRVWRLYKTRYRAEHTLAGCPNKKLSCRSEPAQRFVSIKIFAKSLKSFKVIRNYYGEYGVHMILLVIHCGRKYTASQKKLDLSSFEHNSCKYCPILIILSLLQTEIICPQTNNWISYFTCSLLLHYLEKCNPIPYTSSQKLLNKSAMHAVNFTVVTRQEILVISLTDFFDAASRRHNDVILLPAIRRVSGNDFVFQQDSAPHTAPSTCNSWTAASTNVKLSSTQSVASKQPRSQSCGLRDLGCHAASCLSQTNS